MSVAKELLITVSQKKIFFKMNMVSQNNNVYNCDGPESAFTDGSGVNPAQGLRLERTN